MRKPRTDPQPSPLGSNFHCYGCGDELEVHTVFPLDGINERDRTYEAAYLAALEEAWRHGWWIPVPSSGLCFQCVIREFQVLPQPMCRPAASMAAWAEARLAEQEAKAAKRRERSDE